jgi:hypothetical protein
VSGLLHVAHPREWWSGIIVYTKHGISREFDVQSRVYVPLVGGPPEVCGWEIGYE